MAPLALPGLDLSGGLLELPPAALRARQWVRPQARRQEPQQAAYPGRLPVRPQAGLPAVRRACPRVDRRGREAAWLAVRTWEVRLAGLPEEGELRLWVGWLFRPH